MSSAFSASRSPSSTGRRICASSRWKNWACAVSAWSRASPSPSRSAARRCSSGCRKKRRSSLRSSDLSSKGAEHRQRRRDRARGLGGEAAAEHREPRQRLALGRAEQLPGVVEDDLDAGLARRPRRVDGAQQLAALAQLGGDRLARQHARPRGRQLERQRQAARPGGRCRPSPPARRRRGSVGSTRRAARTNSRTASNASRWSASSGSGQGRPSSGKVHSAGDAEAHPGRDQHAQARAARRSASRSAARAATSCSKLSSTSSSCRPRRRLDRLLERIGPSAPARPRPRAPAGCRARAAVAASSRATKTAPSLKSGASSAISAARQARLADAARPDQADQAAIVLRQQLGDAPPLDRAADEAVVAGLGVGRGRRRTQACRGAGADQAVVQRLQLGAGREAQVVAEAGDERPVGLARRGRPGRSRASACRCRRSAASSSGSASSRRAGQRDGLASRRCSPAARCSDGAAPGGAQPVALEAEPAASRLRCRRRRSRRAGRRRSRRRASSMRPSRSAASNSATSVGRRGAGRLPSSSIGRPQGTRCRRNSVLRRLAKASFWLCSGQKHRRELGPADPGALQREVDQQLAAALERQGGRPAAEIDRRRAEEVQAGGHRGREEPADFPVRRRPAQAARAMNLRARASDGRRRQRGPTA